MLVGYFIRRAAIALGLSLAISVAAHAQERSSSAQMHVSAQVVPSCRILQAAPTLVPRVHLSCTRGIPVQPRVQVVETVRGQLHVVNF